MTVIGFAYLTALLVSIGGMLVIDARHRLVFWRAPLAASVTIAIGMAVLLAADVIGIANGIFGIGDTDFMTGIVLAPHLPLEELFFLFFLCQLTLVIHELARRIPRRRPDAGAGERR